MPVNLVDFIVLGLLWYIAFVASTTLHEAAHALAARWLGDPTAYYAGQVTLNPVAHAAREPLGMIIVPLVSYVASGSGGWMIGWASAPYDPFWARRYPQRAALMALAGPLTNLALVLLAALLIRLGLWTGAFEIARVPVPPDVVVWNDGQRNPLSALVSILFVLNLVLFAFNLLPFPPLDGSSIIQLFMRRSTAVRWQDFVHQPIVGLVGIVAAWMVFYKYFPPIYFAALRVLFFERGLG
ncbi:MAG: site-2 protease family protein [Planctomycetia bacterium]|nr:site-2 protease family protein [Planctomycetia bacterium]